MAEKKFPSELVERTTVKMTDTVMIHNVDTGATNFITVSNLMKALALNDSNALNDIGSVTNMFKDAWADRFKTRPTLNAGVNVKGIYLYNYAGDTIQGEFAGKFLNGELDYMFIGATYLDYIAKFSSTGVYITANCSALSFTDRTPFYDGDALTEIMKIKGVDGKIDHKSLPEFARVIHKNDITEERTKTVKGKKVIQTVKVGEEEVEERDLGAMISILTKAIQQLKTENEELTAKIETLENK